MKKIKRGPAGSSANGPSRSRAKFFRPHAFRNEVSLIGGEPLIIVTPEVQEGMYHIADQARGEAGWLGTVSELPERTYVIDELFIFKQRVDALTNTLTREGLSAVGMEILRRPDGMEVWNRVRFWGHSHGTLSTAPSFQDKQQFSLLGNSGFPYFIRGIINRLGRMEFSIMYYDSGILIEDVPWQISNTITDNQAEFIANQLAEKVTWVDQRRVGKGAIGGFFDGLLVSGLPGDLTVEEMLVLGGGS